MSGSSQRGPRHLAVLAGVVAAQCNHEQVQCRALEEEVLAAAILRGHFRERVVAAWFVDEVAGQQILVKRRTCLNVEVTEGS
ncbi:hypothetical protein D3C71_2007010 [compost metagenome]